MFARIKLYNPKRGLTTKTYAVAGNLFRVAAPGDAGGGWYEVGKKLAEYLETILTDPTNPESAKIFEVVAVIPKADAAAAPPPPPGQTAPGQNEKPHELLSEQVRDTTARRPPLDTDAPEPDGPPGGGDPEMVAKPVPGAPALPGAPKRGPGRPKKNPEAVVGK